MGKILRGVQEVIPAGIPPVLKRFWKFTRDNSKQFAKHLQNPQEKEEEFNKAVIRKFKA
jgi:hypothetical protein